jgi:hypothetical protein
MVGVDGGNEKLGFVEWVCRVEIDIFPKPEGVATRKLVCGFHA